MAAPSNNRLTLVVGVSIGLHLLLGFILMRMPVGQALLKRVIPVQLVERQKPKSEPKKQPPKPKKATPVKHAAHPQPVRPRPLMAPPSNHPGNSGQTFGMARGSGDGGTVEVPVGKTLETESTASAPAPLVLDVSDDASSRPFDREPTPIGCMRVAYPEIARVSGATGSALVQAYVEADGHVSRAELLKATSHTFGKSALEAVRETRFKPATRSGVPVACTIRLPIRFELTGITLASPASASDVIEDPVATPSGAQP